MGYTSIEYIFVQMGRRGKAEQQRLRELLRDLREKAELRQIDLGKRLGRHQSFVSKYESGERTLDFLEVKDICRALDISLADFVRKFEES